MAVYTAHELHLLASFRIVLLIDTKSIDPHAIIRRELEEKFVKISANCNSLAIDEDVECRVFGSPDVGQCDIRGYRSSVVEAVDAERAGN